MKIEFKTSDELNELLNSLKSTCDEKYTRSSNEYYDLYLGGSYWDALPKIIEAAENNIEVFKTENGNVIIGNLEDLKAKITALEKRVNDEWIEEEIERQKNDQLLRFIEDHANYDFYQHGISGFVDVIMSDEKIANLRRILKLRSFE